MTNPSPTNSPHNPLAALYGFWMGVPLPVRNQISAFRTVAILSFCTIFSTLYGSFLSDGGNPNHVVEFLQYAGTHWFGGIAGIIVASVVRGKLTKTKTENTVQLDSGATATLLTPPTDGTKYPAVTP